MQFKIDDLVRVLDWNDVTGTIIEINDEQIIVHDERHCALLFCDPENVELVTEWYDSGVRLPFSIDQEERTWRSEVKL